MEQKYFKPTKSDKDGLWRLRITSSEEDEIGALTTKTGFIAFKDEEKANKAFEMFNENVLAPVFGNKLQPGLYELTYEKVEVETEVA